MQVFLLIVIINFYEYFFGAEKSLKGMPSPAFSPYETEWKIFQNATLSASFLFNKIMILFCRLQNDGNDGERPIWLPQENSRVGYLTAFGLFLWNIRNTTLFPSVWGFGQNLRQKKSLIQYIMTHGLWFFQRSPKKKIKITSHFYTAKVFVSMPTILLS